MLYSFAGGNGDGGLPEAALIFDTAGNLYGTTGEGGAVGPGGVAGGIVFELSPSQGGGWTEKVLYNFCSVSDPHRPLGGLSSPTRPPAGEFCLDGAEPDTNLIFDAAGNLYGTTLIGGYSVPCAYSGCGTVFELSPTAGGSWTEQVLYSFCPQTDCADGSTPTAGLIFDASGNLYSTTAYGGIGNCYGGYGDVYCGTVFELSPGQGGGWTEQVLYSFNWNGNNTDAAIPQAGLVFDPAGNLYGTTGSGGTYSFGAAFELGKLGATNTALTTSPNPSNVGQAVTMTGTVTAENGSLPTGTVVFQNNGVNIGSASLNNSGVAVLNYAALPVGTDSVVAMYQGSASLGGSTSNTVSQVVMPLSSMTSVTSAPNPSAFGQQVMITATVSPSGPPVPTGTVGFTSNGTAISGCTAVTLSSQTAVCMTSTLALGYDTITANYSGDSNYAGSSGMLSHVVEIATTTALTTAPNPSNLGQSVTMTATVTAQNGSLPTGTVIFDSNGVQVGSALLNNSGVAVLNYAGLNIGTNNLTAVYQGSGQHWPSAPPIP